MDSRLSVIYIINNKRELFKWKKKSKNICLVIGACLILNACSVGMALSGKKDPDLSVIRKGADRSEIELQLGSPIKTTVQEDGSSISIYEYEIGNEPSTGRAVAHGAMDFITLGLWEVVGTPVEAIKGTKYQISIHYDNEGRVMKSGKSY